MSRLFDLPTTPIEDGVTVVEASAGTGKTYCLTGLVLRLLLERRVADVSQILVVTFTRAATQELKERLRGALRELAQRLAGEEASDDPFLLHLAKTYGGDGDSLALVRDALVRFDDLTVSTIHGFCRRVLADSAFSSGVPFEAEMLEDDAPLLLDAARDVWRRRLYPAPDLVAAIAVDEGWGPRTFLADYEAWRRHPHTEILPPPEALDAAVAGLEQAHRSLGEAWDSDALERLLETRRFRRGAYFAGALAKRLGEAEAFCRDAGLSGLARPGLRAVKELAAPNLEKSLFKRDLGGVLGHPTVRAATAFSERIEALRHALRCAFIAEVDARFDAAKRTTLSLTYDDLLRRLRDALADGERGGALAEAVRQRYRAALIDEFQDTDLIQYDIFRRLFRRGPLFLIGDPKQAIYRFRGADVFAYLAAKGEADRAYTLEHNWRTAEPLVEAVNDLFSPPHRPFVFERIAFQRVAAARRDDDAGTRLAGDGRRPLQWLWVPRLENREETRAAIESAVVAEILRLLSGGISLAGRPLAPDDVAVLVRTNEQATSLQDALRAAAVPSVVGRAGDVFASEEMADLATLLAAIADPSYAPRLRAAWATRLWGDDAAAIGRLNRDDEAFASRLESFASYRDDWLRRGFMPMIQGIFAGQRVRRRLLATRGGERRLSNLLQAVELLHAAQRQRQLTPAALLTWLAGERRRPRAASDETELRLESDAPAVQVSTVHRSKGLEYEIVFCPFLWQARTVGPPPVAAHVDVERVVFDYGSDRLAEHTALAEAERLAEEARLTYVALTRARQRCYVVWGDVPGRDGPAASALGYLLRPAGRDPGADPEAAGRLPAAAGEWVERALAEAQAGREGWRRGLEQFVARHAGVMELRSIETMTPGPPLSRDLPDEPALSPRPFQGRVPAAWSVESFSSLSRGGEAETPDHGDPATPGAQQPGARQLAAPPPPETPPDPIFSFARGRRAGTCLHHILERCDFTDVENPETERQIAETLRRYGLEQASSHATGAARRDGAGLDFDPAVVVRDLLRRLAAAPLPGAGVSLAAVPRRQCLVEWRFTTPLADLAPRRLADVFRAYGRGAVGDDYAPRLESLSPAAVRGYLTGFVDLIFTHGDRWYLIDWKSNDLGPNAAAYGPQEVWQAMCDHHYVLQYHLYALALHRFLKGRLADYDYSRHVAGAYYVFLRGLATEGARADGAAATGWYVDAPPGELIAALERLVDGGVR